MTSSVVPARSDLAVEERPDLSATDRDAWRSLVKRLSTQSVEKHFDAYADVAWDDPEMAIDPHDPRWEMSADLVGRSEWYRSQPPEIRAEIGLLRIASTMKVGLFFENVVQRGLLEYAARLPNGSPEFRYAYHEVIEEGHHSMMFQEFVNRCGVEVRDMPRLTHVLSRVAVQLGRYRPEMFFIFVLGGEDPIDYRQRETLRSNRELHPLLERIMRIHVTEEARHLSFARHLLKQRVPELSPVARFALSVQAPIALGIMAGMMLRPPHSLIRRYGIPRDVVANAYRSKEARQSAARSIRKVRNVCIELGLATPVTKPLWKALHIWDDGGTGAD